MFDTDKKIIEKFKFQILTIALAICIFLLLLYNSKLILWSLGIVLILFISWAIKSLIKEFYNERKKDEKDILIQK